CFAHFFNFGFSGVDIFFVLSGFIIYYSTVQKPQLTSSEFLLRRFIRIFPVYWIAIIVILSMYGIGMFYPNLFGKHQVIYEAVKAGGVKFIFISFILLPFTNPSLLSVSWTLSFEMLFYFLFWAAFFRSKKFFWTCLIFWVVASFIHPVNFWEKNTGSLMPMLNPIVSEFLFGCVAAIFAFKYGRCYSNTALVLGVIFFSISVFVNAGQESYREFSYGIPAAFIVYGFFGLQFNIPLMFRYLGDASYSIYIFHVPLLSVLAKNNFLFSKIGVTEASILIFTIVVLVGCFVHTYIENPLLTLCRKKLLFFTDDNVRTKIAGGYST
ncbi:MAG: acyltransferase, partial [Gammaproteobacteria bacterium]|nr:acyltransferase [Gammaproteobacteria bacterium]